MLGLRWHIDGSQGVVVGEACLSVGPPLAHRWQPRSSSGRGVSQC